MFEIIKSEIHSLYLQNLYLKEKERHYLENARRLKGIFSKKHQKGEEKPVIPQELLKIQEQDDAEEKALQDYEKFWGLQHVRKNHVRKLARNVHLAYMFMKGTPALSAERIKRENPNWDMIWTIVQDMSQLEGLEDFKDHRIIAQRFAEWKDLGQYPPEGKKRIEERQRRQNILNMLIQDNNAKTTKP